MNTIYRAANSTDLFVGAHFAATEAEAIAYTDNPGFGGAVVFSAQADNVLRCDDISDLADALVEMGIDDSGTFDGFADDWKNRGFSEVFQVIENVSGVVQTLIASGYAWIRFDEPSIADDSEMSTTYRYLGV